MVIMSANAVSLYAVTSTGKDMFTMSIKKIPHFVGATLEPVTRCPYVSTATVQRICFNKVSTTPVPFYSF